MTLCNNLQRKWVVGAFLGVDVYPRDYGTISDHKNYEYNINAVSAFFAAVYL